MEMRSGGRKLSFDLLAYENSGDEESSLSRSFSDAVRENMVDSDLISSTKQHRRKRRSKKKKPNASDPGLVRNDLHPTVDPRDFANGECADREINRNRELHTLKHSCHENGADMNGLEVEFRINGISSSVSKESEDFANSETVYECVDQNFQKLSVTGVSTIELRQRPVNGSVLEQVPEMSGPAKTDEESELEEEAKRPLETVPSLDWKSLTANDLSHPLPVDNYPLQYFMGEIYGGNSLRSTTSVANEKKRRRVYNTMFHVPWRCELLIDVGFFVCVDSFLSLLTIMPARILMTFWRFLNIRQFQRPRAAELSDFGCFVVLVCGVTLLQATDISLIYHIIRGQGTLKLYVVYNVLEIFDKLCQSFGADAVQVLFSSAEGVANLLVHSFVLLAQAITLSTCIIAHNNALLALLVSNNFAEIKSNVFKRASKENLHKLVYYDTVERFHIMAYIIFVLAQNILEAEGPWFNSFLTNAFLVCASEVAVDIIKHSFLAKFNEVKPEAYSEFLEDLCKQTLDIPSEEGRKNLTFVPLAPACVVIRVLTPIYAAHLPYGPLPWRLFWISVLTSMTYAMLAMLKILVGLGLRMHAAWYVNRCRQKKHHLHID
ncbi:hypothetical protein AMTR_s00138p00039840 [Amborella trichopoda]|uniref:Protein POLLEN DEFECTIVE IN GUIDANCE 1 n=1 Tax=Amborella trichopoda TaxID=13333 RepID=W1NEH6_AMBTC|nr:hypothetical protein AMTR_s00138p00039840 [Amborella trichopoda]